MANPPKTGEQAPAAPGSDPSSTAPPADPSSPSSSPADDPALDAAATPPEGEPGVPELIDAADTAKARLEPSAEDLAASADPEPAELDPNAELDPDDELDGEDGEIDENAKTQIFTPRTLPGFGDRRAATADAPSPPPPPVSFDELRLPEVLRRAVTSMGWDQPTAVQQMTFPLVTSGRDVLVQSQTGSGKTAAFCLPWLAQRFEAGDAAQTGVQLLVLTPTRELAKQVCEQLEQLGRDSEVRTLPVYGGTAMQPQLQALREGVHAVVGTPGRILDHIRRRSLKLDRVRMAVLDEADEMLSMGFLEDIHAILDACATERQTCLFSATVPPDIERIARRYMRNPESVLLSGDQVAAAEIEHAYYQVSGTLKVRDLLDLVAVEEPPNALIFCNTREETYVVASALHREGYHAEPLSSDLTQAARERVMGRMRSGQLRFLVATDVASRGIDISHIGHVINYSFPENAESYVHRTGRTGRAGRPGEAISLIAPQELGNFYYLKLQYPSIVLEERSLPPAEELSRQRLENKIDQVSRLFPELVAPEWVLLTRHLVSDPRGEQVIAFLLKEAMARVASEREQGSGDLELRRPRSDGDRRGRGRARREREDWGEPAERDRPRGRGREDDDRSRGRGRWDDERPTRAREGDDERRTRSREGDDERRTRAREGDDERRTRSREGDDERRTRSREGDERRSRRRDGGRRDEAPRDETPRDETPRDEAVEERRDEPALEQAPREGARERDERDREGDGQEPRRGRRRRRGRDRRDEREGDDAREAGPADGGDEAGPSTLEDERAPTLALSEEELSEALGRAQDQSDRAEPEQDETDEETAAGEVSTREGGRRRRRRRRGRRSREEGDGEPRLEARDDDDEADDASAGETTIATPAPPVAGEDLGSTIDVGVAEDEAEGETVEASSGTDEVTDPGTITGVGSRRRRRRRRRRGRGRGDEGGPEAEGDDEGREASADDDAVEAREGDEGDDEDTEDEGGDKGDGRRRRRRRRGGRRRARGEGGERGERAPAQAQAATPVVPSQDQIVIDIDEDELEVVRDEFGEIDELDDLTLKGRRRGVMESLQEEVELEDLSDEDRDDEDRDDDDEDRDDDAEEADGASEPATEGEEADTAEAAEGDEDEDPREAKKRKRRRRRRSSKKKAEPAPPPELTAPPHKDFWEVWAAKFTYKEFEDDTYLGGTAAVVDEPEPVRARTRERERERKPPPPPAEPPRMPAVEDEDTFVRVRLNVGRKHGKKAAHIRELLAVSFGLARKAVRDLTVGEASTRFRLGELALARLEELIVGFELDGIPLTVTRIEARPDDSEEETDAAASPTTAPTQAAPEAKAVEAAPERDATSAAKAAAEPEAAPAATEEEPAAPATEASAAGAEPPADEPAQASVRSAEVVDEAEPEQSAAT